MSDPRSGRPVIPGSGVNAHLLGLREQAASRKANSPQIRSARVHRSAPIRSGIVLTRNVKRIPSAKTPMLQVYRSWAMLPAQRWASSVRCARAARTDPDTEWIGLEKLLGARAKFHYGHWSEQSDQMRNLADGS